MAFDGGVERAGEGVVDYADEGRALDREAEGDADVGVVVDEVGRAVDWVDDEGWSIGEGLRWGVSFFAHEPVCGE